MTERTVTEAEVIAALEKLGHTAYQLTITANIMIELFPELPKVGELILCWDENEPDQKNWCCFVGISNDGRSIAIDHEGDEEPWDNYRRLTPAERGEG
jgi:hypothetical protein